MSHRMSRATKSDSAVTTMPPLDGWRTLRRVDDDLLYVVEIDVFMCFGTTTLCGDGGRRNAVVDCKTAAESSIKDAVVMVTVLWSVLQCFSVGVEL
mmetsp:Transcript_20406/g.29208  ORF Transcript_20406/g.29208 Transcript_20406/m.29208 type:complete len:96 (+) Transcript_20406:625-912(+)